MLTFTVMKDGFPVVMWQPVVPTEAAAIQYFLLTGGEGADRIPANVQGAVYQSVLMLVYHAQVRRIEIEGGWEVLAQEL